MIKWVLLGILIGFALSVRVTHAGVDGIFAEQSTQFDWVTVRRVHDSREKVDCYVASSRMQGYNQGMIPAISCLKVDR